MWWQWYGQGITPAIRWFCELVAMVTKLCFWQVSFSITRCPSKLQFHVYERVVIQLVHSVTWCILYFFDRYWWTCFILMMWRHQWKQRLVKRKKQLTAFTLSLIIPTLFLIKVELFFFIPTLIGEEFSWLISMEISQLWRSQPTS